MARRGYGVVVLGKKRPRESVSQQEGRNAAKAILELNESDLCDESKSTLLPYPGLGRSVSRPPVNLKYVGRPCLLALLVCWNVGYTRFLIYGPKGMGKSSDFRALACILFKWTREEEVTKQHGKTRLIVLFVEIFLTEPINALRDGLLFSFMVDGGCSEAEEQIMRIRSLQDVLDFIYKRQQEEVEVFHFLVDGAEQLDPLDFLAKPLNDGELRAERARNLQDVLSMASRIWWCASSKSSSVRQLSSVVSYPYDKDWVFNEIEYATYAANAGLSTLPKHRLPTVEYYTGFIPLFLDALLDSCATVAHGLMTTGGVDLLSTVLKERIDFLASLTSDVAVVGEEDEYWEAALRAFVKHKDVKAVRLKASALVVKGECDTDADMAALDTTYVLDAEQGTYCSAYIKRVYTQQVRAKEEALKTYADGAWMAYANRLLSKGSIDWSVMGKLCEDVLASVIGNKGLILGGLRIPGLTVVDFTEIPCRELAKLQNLKANSGYYYKPLDVSFPDVDAVLVWIDEARKLHLIGLQFTVNIDRHLQSAGQFMTLSSLEIWFPDIESYVVDGGSGDKDKLQLQLHFVFLGCSSIPGYNSGLQARGVTKLRTGRWIGTPEYLLHMLPFNNAALPGLSAGDYKVLDEITRRRTWNTSYSDVCPQGLPLLAFKRSELEKMAKKDYNIADPSRKKFRNKELLINAMISTRSD